MRGFALGDGADASRLVEAHSRQASVPMRRGRCRFVTNRALRVNLEGMAVDTGGEALRWWKIPEGSTVGGYRMGGREGHTGGKGLTRCRFLTNRRTKVHPAITLTRLLFMFSTRAASLNFLTEVRPFLYFRGSPFHDANTPSLYVSSYTQQVPTPSKCAPTTTEPSVRKLLSVAAEMLPFIVSPC